MSGTRRNAESLTGGPHIQHASSNPRFPAPATIPATRTTTAPAVNGPHARIDNRMPAMCRGQCDVAAAAVSFGHTNVAVSCQPVVSRQP